MFTSTQTKTTTSSHPRFPFASVPVRSRLRKISIRFACAAAAAVSLLAARPLSAATPLTYLVVPPSGSLPGAGNDGPGVFTLPGYGNVEVTMTNPTPGPLGATYFDQTNAYNQQTSNNLYSWGTDTQRFGIFNNDPTTERYQFNFTFLSGAPNPADLYFAVVGLASGTTATVSQAGNLVGEETFPASGFYPGGPSSNTLYGSAGPLTFSSQGNADQLNTGWALWQPGGPVNIATTGLPTMSFDVSQIPGDGIGFTVAYTTVPEPCSLAFLSVGATGLLGRRRARAKHFSL
jgi:hypothetical protein